MDAHHSANFLDPPVRLATEGTSRCSKSNDVREENGCTSTPCHSGKQKLIVKGIKDHPIIIASGCRGLPFSPPTGTGSSSSSSHVVTSAAPPLACSSSQRSYMSRKGPTHKPDLLSNDSINAHCIQSGQSLCISESSPHDDSFVDLTKRNLHRHVNGKAPKNGDLKNNQADSQKKFGFPNLGSSHSTACFPNVSCNANGCEDRNKVGRSIDSAEVGATRDQSVSIDSPSVCPIVPPRVNRIRRLVRNGCISPNNIAKGKQLVGGDVNGSANVSHHSNVSGPSAAPISVEIMELVANEDDSHMRKGKGVINNPCNSNGLDPRDKNLHDRDSMSFKRKAESGGCRHIHNQTAEMSRPLSPHVEQHFVRETDCSRGSRPHHDNISQRRVQLGKLNGTRSAARAHIKRQKLGSTSSSYVEPAPSAFNDSEVAHVSSSAEASNPKSSSSTAGVLHQIIEVDGSSPQFIRSSHDEAARARQVEADELLARELQEQFYSELPASDAGEVDMQIAAAMQQQDDSNRGFSWASHHPLIERGSTAFNLQTQPQSRPSNIPRRGSRGRASRGRASTLRGTRHRNRFPGQPRTLLPSRGRSSLFPEHLDVDMRMHILGALEEISDTGMATSILRSQHDFNENDYEMLLALDDNNDRHGGAPIHLINGLPQSTVQNDNFDEDCAICLDTPTTGDTIRHLPCLHKFHKDCVDLWLRRKTSCPICKSSIT